MTRCGTLVAAMVSAVALGATPLPLSAYDPAQAGISDLQDCARAALAAAVQVGGDDEAGGALFQSADGLCHYTIPVTQHIPTGVDYRVAVPRNSKMLALYHDHPGTAAPHFFSAPDLNLANRMHLPMYVLVVREGVVMTYLDNRPVRDPLTFRGHYEFSGTRSR